MSKPLTIKDLLEMKRVLDKNSVSEEGRCVHYLDLNGDSVFLSKDTVVTGELIDVMPSWIRCLFLNIKK